MPNIPFMNKLVLISLVSFAIFNTATAQPTIGSADTFKIVVIRPTTTNEDSCCQYVFKTAQCNSSSLYTNVENDPQHVPEEIPAIAWTYNANGCGFGMVRSFLKFSTLISSIPSGAIIDTAKLALYGLYSNLSMPQGNSVYQSSPYNSYGTNEVLIKRVLAPWNRTTLTWNNQPSASTANVVTIPASTVRYGYDVVSDVTGIVRDMQSAGVSYGFSLMQQVEAIYRCMGFYSCYATDTTKIPTLTVYYHTKGTGTSNISTNQFNNDNVNLFPNPVDDILNIRIPINKAVPVDYSLTDMKGQVMKSGTFNTSLGYNTISINTDALPQGSYVLGISDGINSIHKRFAKL
jgi:hypothetical protein